MWRLGREGPTVGLHWQHRRKLLTAKALRKGQRVGRALYAGQREGVDTQEALQSSGGYPTSPLPSSQDNTRNTFTDFFGNNRHPQWVGACSSAPRRS